MKIILVCLSLLLSGCVSTKVFESQLVELEALGEFHKAEREVVKAESLVKTATIALDAAKEKKSIADRNLEKAEEKLFGLLTAE